MRKRDRASKLAVKRAKGVETAERLRLEKIERRKRRAVEAERLRKEKAEAELKRLAEEMLAKDRKAWMKTILKKKPVIKCMHCGEDIKPIGLQEKDHDRFVFEHVGTGEENCAPVDGIRKTGAHQYNDVVGESSGIPYPR